MLDAFSVVFIFFFYFSSNFIRLFILPRFDSCTIHVRKHFKHIGRQAPKKFQDNKITTTKNERHAETKTRHVIKNKYSYSLFRLCVFSLSSYHRCQVLIFFFFFVGSFCWPLVPSVLSACRGARMCSLVMMKTVRFFFLLLCFVSKTWQKTKQSSSQKYTSKLD